MAIDDIILGAQVAAAEHAAELGPVDHPHQMVHDVLGIPFAPGETVLDKVTGQMVEVVHGAVIQTNG